MNEFKAFIKGAQLNKVDTVEQLAQAAIFNAKANNSKNMSVKKLFDANRIRRKIERSDKQVHKEIEQTMKLNEAFKGFKPNFVKKGGT